ncbi:MAG: class I SAM-dependent methyltransferase [Hyphomicrobium sp.]
MRSASCRVCGKKLDHTFVDLGLSPLANSYVSRDAAHLGEKFYPLHVFVCERCFLVQLEEFETPDAIFSHYAYFSSFSKSWLKHAETYADTMIRRFGIGPDSKVVEIASNDGYLLQYFVCRNVPVLGVEPAQNVANVAIKNGVPTHVGFFGVETAEKLLSEGHAADLMAANNVLAHVPDILDFMGGFSRLLKPNGVATFEFPHLLNLIREVQFDTIYHEHFSYLSLTIVRRVAEQFGLRVFDVEELTTHGGSLRVFVCRKTAEHPELPTVKSLLRKEEEFGLTSLAGYAGFAPKVVDIKCRSLEFLIQARNEGKLVVGYGAAAKGNTFLNYCGIGPELVRAVADRSPAKQDTLLPGSRIPVISPEQLLVMKPDYVLILPWNIRNEVMSELSRIADWGGRFVTAIPQIEIR